ncbi:MAG: hypothetical protein IJZ30_06895 [Alphaproteobacteria bacterium]|nr:hypothetical protein [Alphaproteobacteria bacterium]
MVNLNVENAVITLTAVCVFLGIICAVGGFLFYKFYKKNLLNEANYQQRQQELDLKLNELNSGMTSHDEKIEHLDLETVNTKQYNVAMGKLMLEEQKSYLYSVALQIDSLVKKNDLLMSFGLIDDNFGKNRNSQLLVLKGGLQQYADSLAITSNQLTA